MHRTSKYCLYIRQINSGLNLLKIYKEETSRTKTNPKGAGYGFIIFCFVLVFCYRLSTNEVSPLWLHDCLSRPKIF